MEDLRPAAHQSHEYCREGQMQNGIHMVKRHLRAGRSEATPAVGMAAGSDPHHLLHNNTVRVTKLVVSLLFCN